MLAMPVRIITAVGFIALSLSSTLARAAELKVFGAVAMQEITADSGDHQLKRCRNRPEPVTGVRAGGLDGNRPPAAK